MKLLPAATVFSACLIRIEGFVPLTPTQSTSRCVTALQSTDEDQVGLNRRDALSAGISGMVTIAGAPGKASAEWAPAKRPFAYRVDTTSPPTMIPLMNGQKEASVLKDLGRGSGTSKDAITDDKVNLNNMLNKAVFGSISAVQSALGTNEEDLKKSGPGYASFVCFGVPKQTQSEDIGLAVDLLSIMMKSTKTKDRALGLAFAPLSTQTALDSFKTTGDFGALSEAMTTAGVSLEAVQLYQPALNFARKNSLDLLALSPEMEDIKTVRADGLQNVDVERRANYVLDANGFIAMTQDKRFRMYSERSLLKDFEPSSEKDQPGNYFAERILVHEAAATVVSKYAAARPESLVTLIAPTPDLRFLQGINGRIPRICGFINKETNKVNEEAVTTILLNPTAQVSWAAPSHAWLLSI